MAKRGKYRTVDFYRDPKTDREIHGLKRKPDGRFYAAADPLKTFGKDPLKARQEIPSLGSPADQGNRTPTGQAQRQASGQVCGGDEGGRR